MNRRDFLQSAGIASVSLAFPRAERLFSQVLAPDRWRTFQLTTRVEVLKTSGTTRVWVPAALIRETPFQKTFANTFSCEGGTAKLVENKSDALGIIAAEFPADTGAGLGSGAQTFAPRAEIRSRVRHGR